MHRAENNLNTKNQIDPNNVLHIFKSWLAVFVCVLGVNSTNNIYHNDKTNILCRPVQKVSTLLCVCHGRVSCINHFRRNHFNKCNQTWQIIM